ncbi:MAG: restriction endonuclease subunit S [Bacteroidales bacterium]
MKQYPAYKDSGVDWIGEIPNHWNYSRTKFVVGYEKGRNPKELDFIETPWIYLTMEYLRGNPKQVFYVADNSEFITVDDNEILLLWDGSNAGEFIRSRAGVLSSTMALLKIRNSHSNYAWYYLKAFERILKDYTIGMGIPHVNGDEFRNNLFLIPPIDEQLQIAAFLDYKTRQIDDLIKKKQKLIELLKEERTVIINQAVTKGLDPTLSMKDSGIEWLGEIPEHWMVKRLKLLVDNIIEKSNISDFKVALENIESWTGRFLTTENSSELTGEMKSFKPNDVLFNKLRPYLAKVYLPEVDGECVGELLVLRSKTMVIPKFLYYRLLSRDFIEVVNGSTYGAKMPRASWEDFIRNLIIPYPEIKEQNEIVESIDKTTMAIANTIGKLEHEIELISEYKTSLINEAVTGKIDVRDLKT